MKKPRGYANPRPAAAEIGPAAATIRRAPQQAQAPASGGAEPTAINSWTLWMTLDDTGCPHGEPNKPQQTTGTPKWYGTVHSANRPLMLSGHRPR